MVRYSAWCFLTIVSLCLSFAASAENSIEFEPFGKVAVYQGTSPTQVILFLSGKEGWGQPKLVEIAERLAKENYLVLGIDYPTFFAALKDSDGINCPCSDLEALNKYFLKTMKFKDYHPSILLGYGSGAGMAYAAMAQAPRSSFLGVVSLGFNPEFRPPPRFCVGYGLSWDRQDHGLIQFKPTGAFEHPWIVIGGAGEKDEVPKEIQAFVKQVNNGQYLAAEKDYVPQITKAVSELAQSEIALAQKRKIPGIPTVDLPVQGNQEDLAIILSGDGGWGYLERDVALDMNKKGTPVVGFDCLRYFWTDRSPDAAAKDLATTISTYLNDWKKKKALLMGYSMGADVLAVMASHLSPAAMSQVKGIVFLGPSKHSSLNLSMEELESGEDDSGDKILPSIRSIHGLSMLCIGGEKEQQSLCRQLSNTKKPIPNMQVLLTPEGHGFGKSESTFADTILSKMGMQ